MVVLRALGRVVSLAWMVVLALAGLAITLYCINGLIGLGAANPPRLLHLALVRRHVGAFLRDLAAPGPVAGLALVCGLGAMLIGAALIAALVVPARRRLAAISAGTPDGRLAARPAVLRAVARDLAGRAEGVTRIRRARVRLSRRGVRGRLVVSAARSATGDAAAVQRAVEQQLTPITEPFHLRPRIRVRAGDPGERVQ